MKLIAFFTLVCTLQLSANAFSQEVRIDLDMQKVKASKVIDFLKSKTDLIFFYNQEIGDDKIVSIKSDNLTIQEVLDEVTSQMGCSYEIIENYVVLIKENLQKAENEEFDPITVKGKVTDSDGKPLPNATIMIKGTFKGITTNTDGEYSIKVPDSKTILVFSYVGFAQQEIFVGNKTTINVILEVASTELGEVVINAGYYNVKEREKTGSIAKVEAKAIEQQPVSNPLAALQGRMPGVQITESTGSAGAGFKVRIRGQNSIAAGNEPLFIIDGIPYDSKSMSHNYVSQILRGDLSPFSLINPSDIESVEVLKDADATAIYGSRGANGVLLITTKKGKAGKTTFSVSANIGTGKITNFLEYMNTEQFLEMKREAYANNGIAEEDIPAWDYALLEWPEDRYTDWQEVLLGGTARTNNLQASVSGGNSQTQFFLSGGYKTETSVIIGDNKYKRGSVLAKVNHSSLDKRFNILFSANYAVENGSLPVYDAVFNATTLPPNAPPLRKEDGSINFEPGFNNPLPNLLNIYEHERYNLLASTVISYQILSGLEFKVNLGYTATVLEDYATFPGTTRNAPPYNDSKYSYITRNNSARRSWTIEPQVNWERSIGKGKLTVLVGATFQKQIDKQFLAQGQDFPSDKLIYNLSAATNKFITGDDKKQYKYNALFGRLNYNWEGKYIFNVTGRRDGSSRFGPNKKFANFGALGVAWIFTKEPFIKEMLPFISFGKLRGSYGSSGNDQIG
ncbi:MAG: SusC/RagA family TonB-linked outer membrane protein, partial [Clostridia bacterium]|nr:SusC/RagA family TonB-linked outer membrane protein [Clostridia bacterium]